MLNSIQPEYADVSRSRCYIGAELTRRLGNYLLPANFKQRWYHPRSKMDEDIYLHKAIRGFGREPSLLQEAYWYILSNRDILRTADEERRRQFLRKTEEDIPDMAFSKEVYRYLRACLRSCGPTFQQTSIMCAEGVGLVSTTMWEENNTMARVHRNWFLQDQAALELGLSSTIGPSLVSQAVKQVFRSITQQMEEWRFGPNHLIDRPRNWYIETTTTQVEQRLFDCMQLKKHLRNKTTGLPHEPKLVVSWILDSSWRHGKDLLPVEVHQLTHCTHLKNILLAKNVRLQVQPPLKYVTDNPRA
ncbi:hypothetical protein PG993_001745 [Apiospora rasikravindrae]|uniref:Uncharacterized protein n=1 Tax=Apiospora rasikravindrae TaxID=990691 RepID=A0ABR1UC93_9PEZI